MDMERIRRLAGLMVEGFDDEDDDGLSPAERKLASMGKPLDKEEEKAISKADAKSETVGIKKTSKEIDKISKEEADEKKAAAAKKAADAAEAAKQKAEMDKDADIKETLDFCRKIAGITEEEIPECDVVIIYEGEKIAAMYSGTKITSAKEFLKKMNGKGRIATHKFSK